MKIFKLNEQSDTVCDDLRGALKKLLVEHFDGLPLARGIAFEQDSTCRFWGETSSGVYCARILDKDPSDFFEIEDLRYELLKLKSAFESGVDFFIFFREREAFLPGTALIRERLKALFSDFKSIRFISFMPLVSAEGECGVAFRDIFYFEKEKPAVENPLPVLDMDFEQSSPGDGRSFSGHAALNRHEIEEFFEIGLELRRMVRE